MTIFDKVRKDFITVKLEKYLLTQEIIQKYILILGESDSIISSDYCYNMNNGIYNYENYLHIFEQIQRGSINIWAKTIPIQASV